jgi:oxaloacetate decarboxylase alpha subunit
MTRISFHDTTLRDGHQCLWATRMSTPMMLPVIDAMDRAGFDVLEIMGAVQFDTCVRFLNENPWQRLRTLCGRIRRTTRQAIIRSKCALSFELQPDDINRLWVELLIKNGIERIIAFDGLHDLDNIEDALRHAKQLGAWTEGWLIFSISPVHTDAFYATVARGFIDRCGVDALMIEDTSGILTPERAKTLIPAIKREIGGMRLGLHTHNLAGLAQLAYIEAAGLGVDNLYTCIAPIADGNAPPAIQTTVNNLRHLGFEDSIDDAKIAEIASYFKALAIQEGKPLGRPHDYDAAIFEHQIPGGVMSNLASQLESAGHGDKLQAVLDECGTVREELGWPIQVTPFSQFIGVQATLNVTAGERYARVPDAVKKYALGYYGKTMAPVDPNVLDRIVENGSRAIAIVPPAPEPALPGLRKAYPGAGDEELMLRHAFPAAAVDAVLGGTGNAQDYSRLGTPLVELVRSLVLRPNIKTVNLQTTDTRIEFRRNAAG